jgi:hypothetical protein
LTTGGAATCSGAGAATVDLDLQDTAGNSYHDTFTCSDYQGTSEPCLPATTQSPCGPTTQRRLAERVGRSHHVPIYAGSVTQLPNVVLQVK